MYKFDIFSIYYLYFTNKLQLQLQITNKLFSVTNSFDFDIDLFNMNCYILFSVIFQSVANLADHLAAASTATTAPTTTQSGSAQPNSTSPTSPTGSVGSTGSHSSSGYSSSDHPNRNQGIMMPMSVLNAVTSQNQNFAYLLAYMDLWDTADNLVQNGGLTGKLTYYFLDYLIFVQIICLFVS